MLTVSRIGFVLFVAGVLATFMRRRLGTSHPGHWFYLAPSIVCGGALVLVRMPMSLSAIIPGVILLACAIAFADALRRNAQAAVGGENWQSKDWKVLAVFGATILALLLVTIIGSSMRAD